MLVNRQPPGSEVPPRAGAEPPPSRGAEAVAPPLGMPTAAELFAAYDSDGNSYLSLDELVVIFGALAYFDNGDPEAVQGMRDFLAAKLVEIQRGLPQQPDHDGYSFGEFHTLYEYLSTHKESFVRDQAEQRVIRGSQNSSVANSEFFLAKSEVAFARSRSGLSVLPDLKVDAAFVQSLQQRPKGLSTADSMMEDLDILVGRAELAVSDTSEDGDDFSREKVAPLSARELAAVEASLHPDDTHENALWRDGVSVATVTEHTVGELKAAHR
jgi:hypothetical protein